ncbi:MAG: hypothetical protein HYR80_05495 [Nitrospirae bacterium]|nr:hypothetical protein [Nitrospirota bacterium]MBI3805755.1 hypothetical protein [Candidatus Manganitrophaceae bacterium]
MSQTHGRYRPFISLWGILFFLFLSLSVAHGFEIKGFSDVDFLKSTLKGDPNENGSFSLGAIDLYVSELVTDHIEILTEMALEDGGVDVERLQIGYIFNDALKIRAGRVHNALGYWNITFHHGKQMQTTIDRPFFIKFEDEGGLFPVHLVGVWTAGRYSLGPLIFGYDLMVGNGSRIMNVGATEGVELDPNNATDDNKNKAVSFRLQVSPRFMTALKIIGSGSFSKVDGYDSTGLRVLQVRQQILNAALIYDQEGQPFELLSEVFWVNNKDELAGLGTSRNTFYYVQLGYTLIDFLTPYTRFEQSLIQEATPTRAGDPYMAALSAVDRWIALVGVRYDISAETALKAEVRRVHERGIENHSEYAVQWSFAF